MQFELYLLLSGREEKYIHEFRNGSKGKECDYRYICGGHCLASEEPYDYRCIFLKAVLNYVLFYYDSKANRRKNLEIYIEYMEEVKRRWEEEPN